jgi:hypothetical protein
LLLGRVRMTLRIPSTVHEDRSSPATQIGVPHSVPRV